MVTVAKPQTPRSLVYILPDGSVDPPSTPILRNGDTYTFTGDVYAEFVVQKGGVVIDGAGYTLHGPYNGTRESLWVIGGGPNQVAPGTLIESSVGVDLGGDASGLTIQNLNIRNFSIGTYLWTPNNTFTGNSVTECNVGVLLSGSENRVVGNYLAKNEFGLFFGTNEPSLASMNLSVSHNCFQENLNQMSGCFCPGPNVTEPVHTWDDGREGNFWSDYNGTDANGDGIGDTPYVFDSQNVDRYPLMTNPVQVSDRSKSATVVPVDLAVTVLAGVTIAVVIGIGVLRVLRRKRMNSSKTEPAGKNN